jgi:hypothetical protein
MWMPSVAISIRKSKELITGRQRWQTTRMEILVEIEKG